jgi:hypothetical protein
MLELGNKLPAQNAQEAEIVQGSLMLSISPGTCPEQPHAWQICGYWPDSPCDWALLNADNRSSIAMRFR